MMLSKSYLKILVTILLSCANTISTPTEDFELKLVNVVFRHGDRTPANTGDESYANDPYKNLDFFPDGPAQLNNAGKKRAYELGVYLRNRYNNFLGELYLPHSVFGRSSDVDRTKMSLQMVLAGLYPPKLQQIWNANINWQPIPTFYAPLHEDNLLMPFMCPEWRAEYQKIQELEEVKAKIAGYSSLMEKVAKYTGRNVNSTIELFYVYHTLLVESIMGLKLPEWTQQYFPDSELKNATIFQFEMFSYNKPLRRRNGGVMIRRIIDDMKETMMKQGHKRKINLYSGHDANVHALLYALGFDRPYLPQFSSAVIVELLLKREKYFIRFVHYLGIPSTGSVITLPGCTEICPFDQFLSLVSDVLPLRNEMPCQKEANKCA